MGKIKQRYIEWIDKWNLDQDDIEDLLDQLKEEAKYDIRSDRDNDTQETT